MAKIIKNAGQQLRDEFEIIFYYDDNSGESTFFQCSADGIPIFRHDRDKMRYDSCSLLGTWKGRNVKKPVVEDFSRLFKYPAELRCDCGQTIHLDEQMNTCRCGIDYDRRGDLLETEKLST